MILREFTASTCTSANHSTTVLLGRRSLQRGLTRAQAPSRERRGGGGEERQWRQPRRAVFFRITQRKTLLLERASHPPHTMTSSPLRPRPMPRICYLLSPHTYYPYAHSLAVDIQNSETPPSVACSCHLLHLLLLVRCCAVVVCCVLCGDACCCLLLPSSLWDRVIHEAHHAEMSVWILRQRIVKVRPACHRPRSHRHLASCQRPASCRPRRP